MAIKIPTTLKLAELKALAFKCGVSSSGTKSVLSQRLIDEISRVKGRKPAGNVSTQQKTAGGDGSGATRILSIDMGIRNLAYCVLDVPVQPSPKNSKTSLPAITNPNAKFLPSIHSWHRLAVSSAPITTTLPIVKEAFDPATLSQIAYKLLRARFLLYNPRYILIERQRFRSMGGKHILEWTIRVNMFESMLYAVLCTLKAEGLWNGEVREVAPGKVGPFWISEEDTNGPEATLRKTRSSANTKVRNKGLKIDLVRRWLESGAVVGLGSKEVEETARAYVEKWARTPGKKRGKEKDLDTNNQSKEEFVKLDDLADSLLQGMAWIQWQENKRLALEHGVEVLLNER